MAMSGAKETHPLQPNYWLIDAAIAFLLLIPVAPLANNRSNVVCSFLFFVLFASPLIRIAFFSFS
jgi:hypothetical protein